MDFYKPKECPNCHSWHIWLAGYCFDLKCPITGLKIPLYRCRDCDWKSNPIEQRKEVAERYGNLLIELGKRIKENQ